MANTDLNNTPFTIVVKQGTAANLALSTTYLLQGEIAYTTDDKQLHVADGSNNKLLVPVTATPSVAGHVLRSNGTLWVDAQLQYSDLGGTLPVSTGVKNQIAYYPATGGTVSADGLLNDSGTVLSYVGSGGIEIVDGGVYAFGLTSGSPPTADTGLTRTAAGTVAVGNGTAGDFSGTIKAAIHNAPTGYQQGSGIAFSHAGSNQANFGANPTITANVTINNGDTVIVVAYGGNEPSVFTSVTDSGGSTYTKQFDTADGLEVWTTSPGGAVASTSVTGHNTGGSEAISIAVATYTGVQSIKNFTREPITASALATNTQTLSEANGFIVSVFAWWSASTFASASANTGNVRTNLASVTNGVIGIALVDNTSATSGASVTDSVTLSTSLNWFGAGMELVPTSNAVGNVLRQNGTNFVSAQLQYSDLGGTPAATANTGVKNQIAYYASGTTLSADGLLNDSGSVLSYVGTGGIEIVDGGVYAFGGSSGSPPTADTGLSRTGAGVVAVGNGTAGDYSGTLKATIVNAVTGFQISGAAASGHYLRGNGTDYVDSAIQASDLPAVTKHFLMQVRIPRTQTLAGNAFSGVVALTNYDWEVWEFLPQVDGAVYAWLEVPQEIATSPSPAIILNWAANNTASSKQVAWQVSVASVPAGSSLNATLYTETQVNVAVPTTAYQRISTSVALTVGASPPTMNAGDLLIVEIRRKGTDATNDTLTTLNALLDSVYLSLSVTT